MRHCPVCNQKLAKGNPNKYCFVHVRTHAGKELDARNDKIREANRKASIKHNLKKKKEREENELH